MKLLRITLGFSALASSAWAGIPAGRGEISLDASTSVTYDSNLSGRTNSQDDVYGTFAPRASYARRAGQIGADLSVGISSHRYVDNKRYNSDDLSASAALRLSEKSFQNMTGSVSASYTEGYQINQDIVARIKTHATMFDGKFGLTTSPRTRFDANASYLNTQRSTLAASDQKMFNGGLSFAFSDFLDGTGLHLSYAYTRAESSGNNLRGAAIDQNSHLYSLGLSRPLWRDVTGQVNYGYRILNRSAAETAAGVTRQTGTVFSASLRGPFLPTSMFPKIKSHLSISYSSATSPGVNDSSASKYVTGDIGLTWAARETTSVTLSASRSQNLASNDLTVIKTDARLSIEQKLGYNLSGTAGAGYTWNTYRTIARSDEMFTANGSLNYTFGAHSSWTTSASYRYQSTTSDLAIATYKRHLAILSVGYHY